MSANSLLFLGIDSTLHQNVGDDGAPSTLTNKQYHINNGDCYYGSKRSVALASAGTFMVHLITSATKKTHTNIEVATGGKCTIDVYAGTTYTGAGIVIPLLNNNSTSAKTTTATAFHTPTTNVLGPQIYEGINNGNTVDALGVGNDSKKIIAPNTDILIVITNTSGSAADFGINFDFFEV